MAGTPKTCSTTTARRKNGWISSRSTKDEAHAWADRSDRQRHGADCSGSISMDHLRGPGRIRIPIWNGHVGWNFRRLDARVCHGGLVLGAREALSRRGQFLSVRGTGVLKDDPRV